MWATRRILGTIFKHERTVMGLEGKVLDRPNSSGPVEDPRVQILRIWTSASSK